MSETTAAYSRPAVRSRGPPPLPAARSRGAPPPAARSRCPPLPALIRPRRT
ncbi:MAG: hypothetical protein ACRDOL_28025 [Streptosporangiaceae bacterium]